MKTNKILDDLKRIKGIKTDTALSEALEINQSQVSRWRKSGFYPSTEKILTEILKEYRDLEEKGKIIENNT